MVQWLRVHLPKKKKKKKNPPSNTGEEGSIPDQGTKVPHASRLLSS